MAEQEKRVLVTVGTTSFDALIRAVDDAGFVDVLKRRGYTSMSIQIGRGKYVPANVVGPGTCGDFEVTQFRFKPNLDAELDAASLVISHAGAGSILESLRRRKDLLVVVNDALMDNHQLELAEAMQAKGVLLCTYCAELAAMLDKADFASLLPYPAADHSLFPALVDEQVFSTPASRIPSPDITGAGM